MRVFRIPKSLLLEINTAAQVLGAIMAANQVAVTEEENEIMHRLIALERDYLALGLHKDDAKIVRDLIHDLKVLLWVRAGSRLFAYKE